VSIEVKVIRRKTAEPKELGNFSGTYPDSLFDGNRAQFNYKWREKLLLTELMCNISD